MTIQGLFITSCLCTQGNKIKFVCQFANMIGQLIQRSFLFQGLFITPSLCWQGNNICLSVHMIGQSKRISSLLQGFFITSSLCWQGNKNCLSVCLSVCACNLLFIISNSTFLKCRLWADIWISDQNYPKFFCSNCLRPCVTFLRLSPLIMVRFSKFNLLLQEENDAVLLIVVRLL